MIRSQPTRNSGAGRGVGKLLTSSFTKTKGRGCRLSTVGAIEGVRQGPVGPGLPEAVSGDLGDTGCLSCSEGRQCTAVCAVFPTERVHEAHSLSRRQMPPCEAGDGLCAVS